MEEGLLIRKMAANSRVVRRDVALSPSSNTRPLAVQQLNFDKLLRRARPTYVSTALADYGDRGNKSEKNTFIAV